MRAINDSNELELYAVAGTHTVVLSMDMKNKPDGLLGFAFERQTLGNGKRIWLYGQKCFQSVISDPAPGQQYPTHLHPVQSFLWKDFGVYPGSSYRYIVTPVFGSPQKLEFGTSATIEVRAEPYCQGKQGVYFNRGVSGSQSYAERFGGQKLKEMAPDKLQLAYEWLSRGLYEGLLEFIKKAKSGQKLRGAFYEFLYAPVLEAFKAAKQRGVDVEIVTSGKNYKAENQQAIAAAGISALCPGLRDKEVNEPHNKFMVLCAAGGEALKVWTGSTNISEKAIFGHCNTGHIVINKPIARKYLAYWQLLRQNPGRAFLRAEVEAIQADIETATLKKGTKVFFSPRRSPNMLQQFAHLIDGAREMVCCIYPFNIDRRFQEVFKKDKPYIRYILLDSHKGFNTFKTDDKDVEVTAGAYIKSPVDQWLKETSAGSLIHHGIDYVHNKIILVDPLGAEPVVVTGSANYSKNSTTLNDENTLVIKGDKRVADIYFTEFVRLFDHFSFREWINKNKNAFKPFLDESGQWVGKYFDHPTYLTFKRKHVFRNMVL